MKNNRLSITFFCILPLLLYMSTAFSWDPTSAGSADMAKIMRALGANLHTVIKLLIATSYVIGVWFISTAINELRIYGQARTMMPLQTTFTGPLSKLLAGTLLLFMPGIIDVSIYTLWGYGVETASTLRFDTTGSEQWDGMMNGIRILIQTFGYVSMIRGFILLSRLGKQQSQPGMFGKGIMHVVGGILAVNIVETIRLIHNTLGFT